MKILVYFDSLGPAGGIERVISKHIHAFASEHDVILITNDSTSSFYTLPETIVHDFLGIDLRLDMNSRIKRICQIGSTFVQTVIRLRRAFRIHRPDMIYVAAPINVLKIFFAQLSCRNILVTEHASFSAYNKIYQFIVRVLYKRVTLLTVPTKDDSFFYSSLGIENTYLPNPLSFFPEIPASLENKIVLNVGRLTDDKRHELLINLWNATQGKNWGWKLHIIGKGENESKIKALIEKLSLQESVLLLPPTKDIAKVYCSASIFVLTSRAEGFGLVLAEAMSSGLPCIAFNCPSGPKDIIVNNQTGYLIDEGDKSYFVSRLDELMINEDLRKALGAEARVDILKFRADVICDKLNKLIIKHFAKLDDDK